MKLNPALLPAAILAISVTIGASPSLACNDMGNCANAPGHNNDVKGEPGPIAGAGLQILAAGYEFTG